MIKRRILEAVMGLLTILAVATNVKFALAGNSDNLEKVIVIDAGHGGIDPGKVSGEILEKDVNLAIAKELEDRLKEQGYTVVMTRTSDKGLYKNSDKNKKTTDLKARCDIIRNCNADMVISIHENSFSSKEINGAQVFYYKHSSEGKKIATSIQSSLKENLNPSNERVAKDNNTYYMLKNTQCPLVIVECGFLSNDEEARLLTTKEYQKKIADAIFIGVENYYGNNSKKS